MINVSFNELADYLRHGREIEFAYKGKEYSITNHSGYWYLCDDTEHKFLETLAPFIDKEALVSKTSILFIDDLTIQQIFDRQLYDKERLHIL